MNDDEREENSELIRMPLWRTAAKEIARSYKSGDLIETPWLLKQLRREPPATAREGMDYAFEVSEIRRYLEHKGLYLSGRGFHGEKLRLLPQPENMDVVEAYQRRGIDLFRRGVILGTATDRTALTDQEAARHESVLCKCAARLALLNRRNPQALVPPPKKKKARELPQ